VAVVVDPQVRRIHGHVHGLGLFLLWRPSASKQMCKTFRDLLNIYKSLIKDK
jgi:hypothetical protein